MSRMNSHADIPLSLYVHIPWCIQKCPYCDFNSHATQGRAFDEAHYVDTLLIDLAHTVEKFKETRVIETIFIGGGTPSLFSGEAIARLLRRVRDTLDFADDIEITLEANPGTVDASHFVDYRQAGVNRLSIGVQSFDNAQLKKLGRIHDASAAKDAVRIAKSAGFDNINIDIMFALPEQSIDSAIDDVMQGIALDTPHFSYYQLTLEPNTAFYRHPPNVPDDEMVTDMTDATYPLLEHAAFTQYEVSAWTRGARCRHNLNYWQHADYLGIGAGAHGKTTVGENIYRTEKPRSPNGYLSNPKGIIKRVAEQDKPFEFMLNALRLREGYQHEWLSERGKIDSAHLDATLRKLIADGLIEKTPTHTRCTDRGFLFINSILTEFLP